MTQQSEFLDFDRTSLLGRRVRLTAIVERFPHFRAEDGRTGEVVTVEPDLIAVRMDEPLDGAEEWDNEIHWFTDGIPLDPDTNLPAYASVLAEFMNDVEIA